VPHGSHQLHNAFTYDVLKCVSQVVFTSTTLYPIFFAQNFGPISYLCKGGQCKSLARVQSAIVLNNNNNHNIMDGPIKKINKLSM
jgi:hypothetical protein